MFDTTPVLDCAGRKLLLDRPRVMGIVNVTPDSFSDGGCARRPLTRRSRTRWHWPGRAPISSTWAANPPARAPREISLEEELRRVIPVIERLARETSLADFHRHLEA